MMPSTPLIALAPPLAAFTIALTVFLLVRWALLGRLHRAADGNRYYGRVLAEAIRIPSLFWALAASLAVALQLTELTPQQNRLAAMWIVIFVIVSLTLAAASIVIGIIGYYGERQRVPFAVAGLSRTLTRVMIYSLGVLVLMRYLGLEITPLVTALGVGGLALALALQDTLANFFAGVHILIEAPISVGDFIRLSTEEEGVVTDIGWRTTRVETLARNVIVIPNTKITSGILTNYSLPDRRVVADIPVLVSHGADPERVIDLAVEAARGVDGVLEDPPPAVLTDPGVLPTHLQFKLLVHVVNRSLEGRVKSDIRLRLLRRLREEGVPLPEIGAPKEAGPGPTRRAN